MFILYFIVRFKVMGRNQGAYLDPSESILMLMVAFYWCC